MTGALVKLGQGVVTALTGGSRTAWLRYLVMWLAIATGATLGALAFTVGGVAALWLAAAICAAATPFSALSVAGARETTSRLHDPKGVV